MIQLTVDERNLFDLLLKVVQEQSPETVLRVAGGWVRDKILGLQSHDIDIALNNISGADFAKLVVKYMKERNLKHGKIAVISARPEQSKHLETAEVHILNHVVDFANLRKENYAESRIPSIEPGTPLEDAQRRDLTINSLFYNINEEQVEDWLDMGLSDLKAGICRTPIDSKQTFIDDPLRILRTIRFAAKFSFSVSEELEAAAKDPQVHEAFKNKISKERIWAEMVGQAEPKGWKHGFLIGPNPVYALELIEKFGFRDILFRPEDKDLFPWDSDQNNPHHDLNIWAHTIIAFKNLWANSLAEDGVNYRFKEEDIAVRTLAMILHDIGKCCPEYRQENPEGHTSYHKHELGSAELADAILETLKAPTHIKERVVRLVGQHMRLHLLPEKPSDRSYRRFLRDLEDDWQHSVDIAIADAYGKMSAQNDKSIRKRYERMRNRMFKLIEEQAGQIVVKRPINGHDLMQELSLKPGPDVGRLLAVLDEQLLVEPHMTREDALHYLRSQL